MRLPSFRFLCTLFLADSHYYCPVIHSPALTAPAEIEISSDRRDSFEIEIQRLHSHPASLAHTKIDRQGPLGFPQLSLLQTHRIDSTCLCLVSIRVPLRPGLYLSRSLATPRHQTANPHFPSTLLEDPLVFQAGPGIS